MQHVKPVCRPLISHSNGRQLHQKNTKNVHSDAILKTLAEMETVAQLKGGGGGEGGGGKALGVPARVVNNESGIVYVGLYCDERS